MKEDWKRENTGLARRFVEWLIGVSRYLLVPFQLGLIVALGFYCIRFLQELVELYHTFGSLQETDLMLRVLTLIDIVMIANLINMIYVGSYHSFVNTLEKDHSEKANSSVLKVKMGASLIGISSIHLLHTFINAAKEEPRVIITKCSIHVLFVVSTIALALIFRSNHDNTNH